MIKRKIISVLMSGMIISFMIIGILPVKAAEQRVFDDAHLFTSEDVTTLESKIAAIVSELQQDIVIVTTNDTNGATSQEYADDFYDTHKFGIGADKTGLLFLIDMDNRVAYVSTCGKTINYLTDARIKQLTDQAASFLKEKKYLSAADTFLDNAEYMIQSGIPDGQYQMDVNDPDYPGGKDSKVSPVAAILLSVAIGLIVGSITCIIIVARYKMKFSAYQYPFREKSQIQLTCVEDNFRNQTLTSHRIESDNDSGGGLSSTHSSGGGTTHGGGGSSF